MSAPLVLLLACATAFVVIILFLVVVAAWAAARNVSGGAPVAVARGTFVAAVFIVPVVAVFALGWGIGSGWT